MNWLFRIHFLRRDILRSLDMGQGFGFASSDVTEFIDSPQETSPSLRNRWEMGWQEVGGEGSEREPGLVCKIKFVFKT